MSAPANVAILGATGSIGRSTLDVIARHPDRFRAYALTANTQVDELFELCVALRPPLAALADARAADTLRARLAAAAVPTEVFAGAAGSSRSPSGRKSTRSWPRSSARPASLRRSARRAPGRSSSSRTRRRW